ncbi:MAG: hypothetical protein U0791_18725 [Gemmataceae bacterium]
MMFTRWKLLTGALGLSVGGWATFGPTADKKVDVPPPPVVAPAPAAAPVSTAATTVVAAPVLPALPALPPAAISDKPNVGVTTGLAPAGVSVPDLDVPVRAPSNQVVELPGLPLPDSKPTETKLPTPPKPVKPETLPVVPVSGFEPAVPPAQPSLPPTPVASPATPSTVAKPTPTPEPALPVVEYTKPATPPMAALAPSAPNANATTPSVSAPAVLTPAPTVPVSTVPSKFRIVLRVGAENPSFEVRHDDDLVMKVVCDKVDIKSPDKGQGPSNVIATGKVRFVGFGAEGTCDSLSFLAGTGEVSLTGSVNVKVRDKIGRVESELNADKMQYKLDQTALTGVLKP